MNCGCPEPEILEVNHVKGGGWREWKAIGNEAVYRGIAKGERDLSEFSVLCRVCNTLDYVKRKAPAIGARFKVAFVIRKSRTE